MLCLVLSCSDGCLMEGKQRGVNLREGRGKERELGGKEGRATCQYVLYERIIYFKPISFLCVSTASARFCVFAASHFGNGPMLFNL